MTRANTWLYAWLHQSLFTRGYSFHLCCFGNSFVKSSYTGNIFFQLVAQHCCIASWSAFVHITTRVASFGNMLHIFFVLLFLYFRAYLHGGKLSLPSFPKPSFTERLYEKGCPCRLSKNLALSGSRMLFISWLVPVRRRTNSQSVYMLKMWLAHRGHPTFKASELPRVTLSPEPTLRFFM